MKQSEIKGLSVAELKEKLGESKQAYAELKMAHALSPLENPLQIRNLRKSIARLATELNQKEANA